MAITLSDFLNPLKSTNIQIVVKDLEQENICKIYADTVSSLDTDLIKRTVSSWDIIRNNLLYVYLNDSEETESVSVTGIELAETTLELIVGNTSTLEYTISPTDATNQNVIWVSTDESIAIISDGLVTAISEGSSTIIVTTEDGGYTATCEVTVITE